MLRKPC